MKIFRRAVAILLSLALFMSVGCVAFAEEPAADAGTAVSVEEALAGAEQDASNLAGTLFRFLSFLHQMYLFFAKLNGVEDPYADFFIDEAGLAHIDAYLKNLHF